MHKVASQTPGITGISKVASADHICKISKDRCE